MLRKIRLAVTALFWSGLAFAQSGTVQVILIDKDTKQPLPFASVVVEKGGAQMGGGQTDIDGKVEIKPIDPGEYDVKAVYAGYQDYEITGVRVTPNQVSYLTMPMASSSQTMQTVTKVGYRVPLVDPHTTTGGTVEKEDYQHMAVKDVNSVAATTAGVYQSDVGGALNIRGARSDATQYIVDGVKLTADQALGGIPQGMVDQVTTITGGIPANYGDATGGIVEINTLGASPKFFANAQAITSEGLDAYGYNDFTFTVGGPILSKMDTATHTKTPKVDFILGGEYANKKDNSPTFIGGYTVNSDVLAQIQANPLTPSTTSGFNRTAEYVTADEITQSKSRANIGQQTIQLNGKLGVHVNNNVSLVFGGAFQYNTQNDFEDVYQLFNSAENPLDNTTTWRAFARLTQRFPTPEGKDKSSLIKNAFYTLQIDYGNTYEVIENNQFKDNLFDYGYIGQFNQYIIPHYSERNGSRGLAYYQDGFQDSALTFNPATSTNPIEANYTSDVYKYLGQAAITNGNVIQQNLGLLNGLRPGDVYSLWYNVGRAYPGYQESNSSHLHFQANFSADVKSNAIQIGFEYEQNILRFFSVSAASLWSLMDQNANLQIAQLDTNNPYLVSGGSLNTYGYNRAYNASVQSQFDKSLRQKLGLPVNGTQWLDPDSYAPGMYSLSMFSASDLLNSGSSLVSYYGYNYDGTKQTSNPTIDDFFNKRDANGNLEYPIAPFHPIYMSGWIQDHFDIKSMKFDVGVRVDRFDANQPVLKDPYLLYLAKNVSEVRNLPIGANIPSGVNGSDIVYVNNAQSPTAIVGYRNGNNWYDANGNAVSDPTVIASATTTGTIQPYLENPSQTTISSNAFTTYTPQINVMPRIAFAFPISDMANFFAHYDIITQRPPGVGYNIFQPTQYMFIQSFISGVLSNPNLLPQQTTDYELGFTQVLDEKQTSALTISAFYKSMKDMIEVYRFLEAYPVSYMAYSNIDFGTVKGMSVSYDLRRVNNVKIRASYTLQFAEGTGSGPNSGFNLANSGSPNLQIPMPLSFDQRHTFLFNIDYHYSSGENYNGPVWTTHSGKSIQVLANAGFNLNFTAGSGTPYTQQANATEGDPNSQNVGIGIAQHYSLVGGVNSAYLPWQYRVDLRVDKDFPLTINKNNKDKAHPCDILVYIQVTNLLNTENILNVYHFTGSASDDGFLSSVGGQQMIPQQTSPQAFIDQYKIKEQDPSYYAMPRQIRLGVEFNF